MGGAFGTFLISLMVVYCRAMFFIKSWGPSNYNSGDLGGLRLLRRALCVDASDPLSCGRGILPTAQQNGCGTQNLKQP